MVGEGHELTCPRHGPVQPLWRPVEVGYDDFAHLVGTGDNASVYLPWPLSPGWSIADFGHVGDVGEVTATFTTTVGSSDLDGPVELTLVSEDPGVGLGARVAGTEGFDPGPKVGRGQHAVRLRAGGRNVPMWIVDRDSDDGDDDEALLEHAVFVGEAEGRWLWLVIRPASAALLLREDWLLADVTGFGPEALELPFGGTRPSW